MSIVTVTMSCGRDMVIPQALALRLFVAGIITWDKADEKYIVRREPGNG